MARVVLDTNNLTSALGWKKGNPRIIFQHCLSGKNTLVESKNLIKEFLPDDCVFHLIFSITFGLLF